MASSEAAQRQQFFNNLLNALRPFPYESVPSHGTFAACETVKPSQGFTLKCFHVEGIGELQLPLAAEDVSKLRNFCQQGLSGESLANVSDTKVQCCWQIDASNLTFPGAPTFISTTVQALAMQAVSAFGLDSAGVQLEAQLCKLLIHEAGGQFTFNRDPEKKKGIVASFVLQLPTEEGYTGGKLVVRHKNKVKEFEGHMVSPVGFCYTIFFAGCLHEVQEIKSGTRICLAFNLVRCASAFDVRPTFDRLNKVEAALEPWLDETTTGLLTVLGSTLYIPLQHKYTEDLLSFPGLKGEDSIAAELLKYCKDNSGEQCLDVHLCLATKLKYRPLTRHDNHWMDEGDEEELLSTKSWIGSDGSRTSSNRLLDMKKIVVGEEEDPFDSEPYEEEYIGDPRTWYHTAMLVARLRPHSFLSACNTCALWAMDILEDMYEVGDSNFRKALHQFVMFGRRDILKLWGYQPARPPVSRDDYLTPRLLNLCSRAKVVKEVSPCLYLLCSKLYIFAQVYSADQLGLKNADVAKAVANTVEVFGWERVSLPIMDIADVCGSSQSEWLAQLVEQLKSIGKMDAGTLLANKVSQALRARIGELESQKMPEFSWCQPLAILSEKLEVENFLRGPQENMVCHGFPSLPKARSFCMRYFNDQPVRSAYCTHSAIGIPGGRGREAYCEIRKTRHLFDFSLDQWQKNQTLIKSLRLDLGRLRSAPCEMNIRPASTAPLVSGPGGIKRQRLSTQVPENIACERVLPEKSI